MGVRNTKYIVYGVETTYEEYAKVSKEDSEDYAEHDSFSDKYCLDYNSDAPYGFIADGMSGRYAVFGTVLARMDEDDDMFPEGVIDFSKLFKEYKLTTKRRAEVKSGVEKLLGHEVKLKKLFINHYS